MEQVEKMSTSQLITEQHGDPEVSPIFSRSVSESEVSQNPTCYFTKNGVPMKMWRPPAVPTEEEWAVQYQMIVLTTAKRDPLACPPGCQQNLPEVLRPFLPAQSKKSCGAILLVVSHLLDG